MTTDQVEELIDNLSDIEYRIINKIQDMDMNKLDTLYKIVNNIENASDNIENASKHLNNSIAQYIELSKKRETEYRQLFKKFVAEQEEQITHNINTTLNETDIKLEMRQAQFKQDMQRQYNSLSRELSKTKDMILYINVIAVISMLAIAIAILMRG